MREMMVQEDHGDSLAGSRAVRWLCVVCLLATVVSYFYVYLAYALNVPFYDDFLSIVAFTTDVHDGGSLLSIFDLHNRQHPNTAVRVTALLSYWLQGDVSLVTLGFIGNLTVVGVATVLTTASRTPTNKLLVAAPVFLLILQPQHHTMMFNVQCTLQTGWLLFLACAALAAVARRGKVPLAVAIAVGACATITMGNGVLVFFVGGAILLVQRRRAALVPWSVASVLAVLLTVARLGGEARQVGAIKGSAVITLPAYVFDFVAAPLYSLASWRAMPGEGGPIEWYWHLFLAVAGAAILLAGFVYFLRRPREANPVLAGIFTFVLLSILLAASMRLGSGPTQALASRYKIYAVTLIASVMLGALEYSAQRRRPFVWAGLLVATLAFNGVSTWLMWPSVVNHRDMVASGIRTWVATGAIVGLAPAEYNAVMSAILDRAVRAGVYTPPTRAADLVHVETTPPAVGDGPRTLQVEIDRVLTRDGTATIVGRAWGEDPSRGPGRICLGLKRGDERMWLEAYPWYDPRVAYYWGTNPDERASFYAVVPTATMAQGSYELSVWLTQPPDSGVGVSTTRLVLDTGEPRLEHNPRPLDLESLLRQAQDRLAPGLGHIDGIGEQTLIDDVVEVPAGRSLELRGWAVDPEATAVTRAILVQIDDGQTIAAPGGLPRGDVVEHFGQPAYLYSGFRIALPPLGSGRHTVTVEAISADGDRRLGIGSLTVVIEGDPPR